MELCKSRSTSNTDRRCCACWDLHLVLNGYTRGHRVNISLPWWISVVFHDRSNYVGGVWRGAFCRRCPTLLCSHVIWSLEDLTGHISQPVLYARLMRPTSAMKSRGPSFLCDLLICLHEYLLSAHERIKRCNCHSYVPWSSASLHHRCYFDIPILLFFSISNCSFIILETKKTQSVINN